MDSYHCALQWQIEPEKTEICVWIEGMGWGLEMAWLGRMINGMIDEEKDSKLDLYEADTKRSKD